RPDAIALLAQFMQSHPRAGAVGAQLIYPDGRRQQSAFRFPGLAQTFLDFFPLHHRLRDSRLNGRYPQRSTAFEIDHPLGACILARGDAIRQVGLLDEGYFMYVEEVDWCRRIKQAGWDIWCEPRAVIVHHEGQATRQFRAAMFAQLWRSRLRYFRKVHSPFYVACIRAIVRVGLWNEARKLAGANVSAAERARRLSAFAEVRALLVTSDK
ncbi:MAG: glycosyltransferase family 2 protein, partial [Chloroflexota bacterium]